MTSVSSDEYGIWARNGCDVRLEEVADVDVDAWGSKLAGILMDDGLALRADFEGADGEMRELQTGLDRDAACAEANVPENVTERQVEGLKRQQADGHLGDHLLTTVEQHEGRVWNAENMI